MKYVTPIFLLALPFFLYAQPIDTAAARLQIDSLVALSDSLLQETRRDESMEAILQAEKKCAQVFGEENAYYARVAFKLGEHYHRRNKLSEAESFYLKAKEIRERTVDSDHPDYILNLSRLGVLYRATNSYDRAEEVYLNAIETLRGSSRAGQDILLARVLNNMAVLQWNLGQLEKAESAHLEAIGLLEEAGAVDHPSYAMHMNNLASLYQEDFGDLEKAQALLEKALEVWEGVVGRDHPNYMTVLHNLANLYRDQGKLDEVEPLYEQALAVRKDHLGEEHPHYALSLYNLGRLYTEQKRFEKAESHYLDAKNIREKALGKIHPEYANSLRSLGVLYSLTEAYDKIEPLHLELFTNRKTHVDIGFRFLSEAEKQAYIRNNIASDIAHIQSAGLHYRSPAGQDLQYDVALLMKGLRLQSGVSTLEYILEQQDPVALDAYQELKKIRHQLSRQYELPLADRQGVAELESEQEEKEKKLARLSAAFRQEQALSDVSYQEIRDSLKAGEAAIEFVHFNYRDPAPTDSVLYAAVLLLPEEEHAHYIPLFEEKQLDKLLDNPGERRLDYVDQLYTFARRGFTARKEKGPSLYSLIWEPIDSLLEGVSTVYFSPAGLLNRLNIGAIPVEEEVILADRYHLRPLLSTRLLVLPPSLKDDENKEALVYGGVAYEFDSLAFAGALENLDSVDVFTSGGEAVGFVNRSASLSRFSFLKWSEQEGEAIDQLLMQNGYASRLVDGYQATEESFKRIGLTDPSPNVLHLCTHGFFFPDPGIEEPEGELVGKGNHHGFQQSEHPMIRSGLAMAGANKAWMGEGPLPGSEDGILTAYEISQLNLTNTELVVLSACETGLGDIKGSEGVFGLQRAFKMAGAHYLIMSLWQVEDYQTQELMVTFYRKWLEEDKTIPDAFRAAQLEMREKYRNPYFWAGFILLE